MSYYPILTCPKCPQKSILDTQVHLRCLKMVPMKFPCPQTGDRNQNEVSSMFRTKVANLVGFIRGKKWLLRPFREVFKPLVRSSGKVSIHLVSHWAKTNLKGAREKAVLLVPFFLPRHFCFHVWAPYSCLGMVWHDMVCFMRIPYNFCLCLSSKLISWYGMA